MNSATTDTTRVIHLPFEKSVLLVRRLFAEAGLAVAGQFDLSREPYFHFGIVRRSCLVLLIDTSVLFFEAIALDRSAAVFLPLHIVICGDRDTSYVHWVNPVATSGLRPPAPAKDALERICLHVGDALSVLPAAVVEAKP